MPKHPSPNLTIDELRAQRMRAQCLFPRLPKTKLVDVVKAVVGIQSQLESAMELALRARVEGLTIEDVEQSRVQEREVVRTWCMRGSMHLLAADDLEWALGAISPADISAGWKWFERKHKLQRPIVEKMLDEAYRLLKANGAMTRRDLMRVITEKHGVTEKAAFGVVWLNGMLGRVCFGADEGAQPTFVALEDWLGRKVKLSDADTAEVAKRYLRGYAPATPQDFAAWWGLPVTEAKKAWAKLELTEQEVDGQTVWSLKPEAATKMDDCVRLLPAFDTYLLGYKDREAAVPKQYQKRIFHGGQTVPVILVNGCAAGTWRYERRGKQFRITAEAFSEFAPEVRDLIAEEAEDIARFYHLKPSLQLP